MPTRSHLLGAVLLACVQVSLAAAQVPSPTVEGPVTGGAGVPFVAATTFDLAEVGYVQEEYFIAGTARSYTSAEVLTSDGMWTVEPAETAAYVTRVLVHRPVKRKKFNGTVVVEWLNVSGGLDAAPDWVFTYTELIRRGYAWMGVSAQRAGVDGVGSIILLPPMPLKEVDPERYGALVHPGDSFSYDIFSQAAQAILAPAGIDPMGDLKVKRLIAIGESQSAFRLTTYVNGIDPLAQIFDGYLIHSRGGGSAPLSEEPPGLVPTPASVLIRSDVRVPVLTFQTETDMTFLGYFDDRQPDGEHFRLWEVAGTAHADIYTVLVGPTDLGDSIDAVDLPITATPLPGMIECPVPLNAGPQHFVLKAAVDALHTWVRKGKAPAEAPRLEIVANPGPVIQRDEHGNALGGIRTPQLDVPIATHTGDIQGGSILCLLFGTTTPFDAAKLAALYPTERAFRSAFKKALKRAQKAGHILRKDAKLMKRWAKRSGIGR